MVGNKITDAPGLQKKSFFTGHPFHLDRLVDIRVDSVSPEYQIDFVGLLHIKLRFIYPCPYFLRNNSFI